MVLYLKKKWHKVPFTQDCFEVWLKLTSGSGDQLKKAVIVCLLSCFIFV